MRKEMRLLKTIPIALVAIGIALAAAPAQAAVMMTLTASDGINVATSPTVTDPPTSQTGFSAQTVGTFTNVGGTATIFSLTPNFNVDLSNAAASTTTGGTLTFDLNATGVTIPGLPGFVTAAITAFTGSLSGGAGQTIREELLINNTVVADTGALLKPATDPWSFTTPTTSGTLNVSGTSFTADLKVIWVVPNGTSGTISLSSDARGNYVVPEPSMIATALMGMPLLGATYWARRRKAKA